ncbi:MAG: LPS export ABC transporter periplasmic protein LptC [Bacteroidales bacterium]
MTHKNTTDLHFKKNSRIQVIKLLAGIFFFCLLVSCQNDMKKIKSLTDFINLPVESAKDITVLRSDSGKLQIYMTSPQLDRYQGEQSYSKYPKGLCVIFYDENRKEIRKLSANYAVDYDERKVMEAKNNVIIIDFKKGDTIYTESILWDRNRKSISSNVLVKRVNKNNILYGDGFDADDSFNNYTLRRPRGNINIDRNE